MADKKYTTIIVLQTALLVAYLYFRIHGLLIAALVLGLLTILSPFVASIIHKLWMKFAHIIGRVSNTIILTLIFILIIIPTGFLHKLFKKSSAKPIDSNFKTRQHTFSKEDFEKPW
jgi:predicted membrane protein